MSVHTKNQKKWTKASKQTSVNKNCKTNMGNIKIWFKCTANIAWQTTKHTTAGQARDQPESCTHPASKSCNFSIQTKGRTKKRQGKVRGHRNMHDHNGAITGKSQPGRELALVIKGRCVVHCKVNSEKMENRQGNKQNAFQSDQKWRGRLRLQVRHHTLRAFAQQQTHSCTSCKGNWKFERKIQKKSNHVNRNRVRFRRQWQPQVDDSW